MAIINILHTYEPSPILMTLGPITIYWYGLFYTISIVLGYWLVSSTLKRILATHYPLPTTHSAALRLTARLPEFTFALVVVGLIGARLYHVLNEWQYYWAHPLQIFAIWNGGLPPSSLAKPSAAGVIILTRSCSATPQPFLGEFLFPQPTDRQNLSNSPTFTQLFYMNHSGILLVQSF
ncbi:MAG: prolipoprotein diacylglyceryl transferase [Parcubacteria group bacterium GW2011_GWA2_46_9]|nr:MAG: prolipoprotein diacylglyceryl transferase [Parcubacteria group bacterium GW2011_GWA2_46_9]